MQRIDFGAISRDSTRRVDMQASLGYTEIVEAASNPDGLRHGS
jgi:hypothetical protein